MKNPMSKEAFLDWVEKRPADRPYTYGSIYACPIAQYGDFLGIYNAWDSPLAELHESLSLDGLQGHPRTFGALAERLRNG